MNTSCTLYAEGLFEKVEFSRARYPGAVIEFGTTFQDHLPITIYSVYE